MLTHELTPCSIRWDRVKFNVEIVVGFFSTLEGHLMGKLRWPALLSPVCSNLARKGAEGVIFGLHSQLATLPPHMFLSLQNLHQL